MNALAVRTDRCELDFLALGALVHRLDPGVVPFRKARSFAVHVSGGEYNVAANLSDCFRLRTGIATAMVDYGIGELVQARVRESGGPPFSEWVEHDGVWRVLTRIDGICRDAMKRRLKRAPRAALSRSSIAPSGPPGPS